jgi:hypothetical protein
MGHHLKKNEFWGIEINGTGFMTLLYFSRKEALDELKRLRGESKNPLKLYQVKPCRIVPGWGLAMRD